MTTDLSTVLASGLPSALSVGRCTTASSACAGERKTIDPALGRTDESPARRGLRRAGRCARGLRVVPGELHAAALAPRARDLLSRPAEVGDHGSGAPAGGTRQRVGSLRFGGCGHRAEHARRSVANRLADRVQDRATRVQIRAPKSCVKPGSYAGLGRAPSAECRLCRGVRMPTGRSSRPPCERTYEYETSSIAPRDARMCAARRSARRPACCR